MNRSLNGLVSVEWKKWEAKKKKFGFSSHDQEPFVCSLISRLLSWVAVKENLCAFWFKLVNFFLTEVWFLVVNRLDFLAERHKFISMWSWCVLETWSFCFVIFAFWVKRKSFIFQLGQWILKSKLQLSLFGLKGNLCVLLTSLFVGLTWRKFRKLISDWKRTEWSLNFPVVIKLFPVHAWYPRKPASS